MTTLPLEVRNRLDIWYLVIKEAYEYMLSEDYFWRLLLENKDKISNYSQEYFIGNNKKHTNVLISAIFGLQIAAVVLFWHIFDKTAQGGNMISSNTNKFLDELRKDIKDYVIKKLDWTSNKYDDFIRRIGKIRHKYAAHYDGRYAEIERIAIDQGFVEKIKLPGVNFNREESKEFILLLETVYEFIEQRMKEFNDK